MKSNEERLQDLLAYVDSLTRVHPSEIPGIDLYMDQVTTFMDSHLNTSKWLGEDKIRAPLFPWFQPGIRRALQRNLFAGKRAAQALAGRRHGKI